MTDPWGGLTDVVLAAACLGGIIAIGPARPAASFGLALIGAAAALGAGEFLALPALKVPHDAATTLAGTLGVPLLGLGAVAAVFPTVRVLPLAAALVVGAALLGGGRYAEIVGGWALVLAALAGARWLREDRVRGGLLVGGAVGAAVAGLGVAGEGDWLGLSRLGWFHLAFAASMAALGAGLRR